MADKGKRLIAGGKLASEEKPVLANKASIS